MNLNAIFAVMNTTYIVQGLVEQEKVPQTKVKPLSAKKH